VLGINTMILGRGTGVGFAVPSRLARSVVEQIAATRLRHPRMDRTARGCGGGT
jgi:serine protease Do